MNRIRIALLTLGGAGILAGGGAAIAEAASSNGTATTPSTTTPGTTTPSTPTPGGSSTTPSQGNADPNCPGM